jgi:hypothetical protein
MDDRDFKNNVTVAVSIAILLWKDATPTASFPKTEELVKIELGRILTHPHVLREFPWLRQRLGSIESDLTSEPWDVIPHLLLEQYIQAIRNPADLELVGRALRDMTFTDPAFDMIRRQGKKPRATAESMISTARGVAKALHIDTTNYHALEDGVRERYRAIFLQLR